MNLFTEYERLRIASTYRRLGVVTSLIYAEFLLWVATHIDLAAPPPSLTPHQWFIGINEVALFVILPPFLIYYFFKNGRS